jgi:hypothetical protein
LAEVAAAAVREGCVGETLAVFQAEAQAERARDRDVQSALRTIADDEARHAELAWAFVRWAVERGGAEVRRAVDRAFDNALEQVLAPPDAGARQTCDRVQLHAHGRLTPEELHASHVEAVAEVIAPAVTALATLPHWVRQAAALSSATDGAHRARGVA